MIICSCVIALVRRDNNNKNINGTAELRAEEALQRDVGKRRARMCQSDMNDMNIKSGDIITISGTKTSCATAWPADEGDEKSAGTIRIDGQSRNNAGVALGQMVSIKVARPQQARTISLVPIGEQQNRTRDMAKKQTGAKQTGAKQTGAKQTGAKQTGAKQTGAKQHDSPDEDFTGFVSKKITGLPVMEGDEISITILGSLRGFRIAATQPRGAVIISADTAVSISADRDADTEARITYDEVGGLSKEIKSMREIVELPLRHPKVFAMFGVEPHSGILLYGPPGCGKTLLARVLASESEAKMFLINGPEIMTKYYGDTEARLREIFKEAKDASPSIIFIDEIDAIAPKREDVRGDVEKRVVAQLLALMDGLNDRGNVMVLGATNRPSSVDPALRRPGRFDREFEISVPNEDGRYDILLIHTRGMPVSDDIDTRQLAAELYGYTGADIRSLCREAALKSIRRYIPEIIDLESDSIPHGVLASMQVTLADFYDAMKEVVPTAMREFYVERPSTKWNEIGGLVDVKESLADNLANAMISPEKFTVMGVRPPRGALVYGPPGCGKSMLGRALAAETGANMILVRGPEILSKWVGESEKALREIFRKAKMSAPCVVILDELDSLARHRAGGAGAAGGVAADGGGTASHGAGETLLSQLLTEIEGAPPRVCTIGITNRPDMLDRALLRNGRLDLALYAAPPDEAGRLEITRILTSKMPLAKDVNQKKMAAYTKNYTGADIAAVCREAAVHAIKAGAKIICEKDFEHALAQVGPSVTKETDKWYQTVRQNISNVVLPSQQDNDGSATPYG